MIPEYQGHDTCKLAAGVVLYNPELSDSEIIKQLDESQIELFVVDNSPDHPVSRNLKGLCAELGVAYLENRVDSSLASGLNHLFQKCAQLNISHLLYFDQDTKVGLHSWPNLDHEYLTTLRTRKIGVVGATWGGLNTSKPNNSMVITSGSIFDIDIVCSIGGASRQFGVDLVDYDLCLRVRAAGAYIETDMNHEMLHQPGVSRPESRWPYAEAHSLARHRQMARNSVLFWRRHIVNFPALILRNFAVRLAGWGSVVVFGPNRNVFGLSVMKGIVEGLSVRLERETMRIESSPRWHG